MLQPRIMKATEQQLARTGIHAEVFTPAWICNKMNNYCDEEMFDNGEDKTENKKTPRCRIFAWRADKSILYESMKKQEG